MKFLLLTDDEDYGKALVRSMTSFRSGITVGMAGIPSKNPERADDWSLVIIDEPPSAEREEELSSHFACPVLFLVDKPCKGDLPMAYKYDSVRSTLKIASAHISPESYTADSTGLDERKTIILVVTGARGGSGKTAISLGIGSELSIFHQHRVLYINGGEFDLTEDWHPIPESDYRKEPGLPRYLFYREGRESVSIENFYHETPRGVGYFYPTGRKNPLNQLTAKETEQLIREIGVKAKVNFLIVDLPSFSGDAAEQIFRQADLFCFVSHCPLGSNEMLTNRKDKDLLEMIGKNSMAPCCYVWNQRFQDEEWDRADGDKEPDRKKDTGVQCFEIGFDPIMKNPETAFDYNPEAGIFNRRMREITQWILDCQDSI